MKKHDALDKIDRAGAQINDLSASAWNTALNPTQYGWGKSLLGVVSIPVLNLAQIGQMVGQAVVRQVNDDTFEKITTLGDSAKKPDSPDKPNP